MIVRRTKLHRSFTLVELVVTIAVIVVLAALTITAVLAMAQGAEVRQTEDTLRLLDVALQEWESQSGRKITWGTQGVPHADSAYDMFDESPHVFTISEVLSRLDKSSQVKPILAQIKPEFMFRYGDGYPDSKPGWIQDNRPASEPDPNAGDAGSAYDGDNLFGRRVSKMITVLDAWGTPIRAVHPGRLMAQGESVDFDVDGTIRLNIDYSNYGVEELYGPAQNNRIYFVSAGPDGLFGNGARSDQADDNLYSYPKLED